MYTQAYRTPAGVGLHLYRRRSNYIGPMAKTLSCNAVNTHIPSHSRHVLPIPTPHHFKFHSYFPPGLKPHSHSSKHSVPSQFGVESTNMIQTSYRPGGGEMICHPVRLAADLRPCADESAVRTPLVVVLWIRPDFAHKFGCHGKVFRRIKKRPLSCIGITHSRHLGFSKIRNFNGKSAVRGQYASLYQISSKTVKRLQRYGDLTFFLSKIGVFG